MREATYWIRALGLEPHPEGGYYRETYRASGRIPGRVAAGPRSFSTAIYYLLPSDQVSTLHRLRSDEILHHYAGAPLTVHVIGPAGEYRRLLLGNDFQAGERFQVVVPAGCWFGATVEKPASYALVGCTVAPGFELADFEQADRARLSKRFPRHAGLIERLTR